MMYDMGLFWLTCLFFLCRNCIFMLGIKRLKGETWLDYGRLYQTPASSLYEYFYSCAYLMREKIQCRHIYIWTLDQKAIKYFDAEQNLVLKSPGPLHHQTQGKICTRTPARAISVKDLCTLIHNLRKSPSPLVQLFTLALICLHRHSVHNRKIHGRKKTLVFGKARMCWFEMSTSVHPSPSSCSVLLCKLTIAPCFPPPCISNIYWSAQRCKRRRGGRHRDAVCFSGCWRFTLLPGDPVVVPQGGSPKRTCTRAAN